MFKRARKREQTKTKIQFWENQIDVANTIPELQAAWRSISEAENIPGRIVGGKLMGRFIDKSLSIAKKEESDVGKQYEIAEKAISVLPIRPLAKAMLIMRTTIRLTD